VYKRQDRDLNWWIESERSQALLGSQQGPAKDEEGRIHQMNDAF